MAYVITHFWPGGTEEQYRATLAAAHPAGGLPEGQIYHAAGPTDGGLVGPPEERTAEVANLQTA